MLGSEHSVDATVTGATRDLRPNLVHVGRDADLRLNLREWIAQHWAGELSLPTSYWLNNILGNVLCFAVIIGVTIGLSFTHNLLLLFPALALTWGVILIVAVWQIVGTWRSAGRTLREDEGWFWPWVVRLLLILAVLNNGRVLVQQAAPQLSDAWQAAVGDPAFGPRGVRILRDGTELELTGGFARGQAAAFKAALDAAPRAHVLHLDSDGGRIGEAVSIRDMMIAREMDTIVDRRCMSACTLVFLGGERRWLGAGAVLGFHSASYVGVAAPMLNDDFRAAFNEAYVPTWFSAVALRTPPTSIWKPTVSQLVDAGVVTNQAPFDQFALAGFGPNPTAESAIGVLNATPQLQALRQADGPGWAEIETAWARDALGGLPATDVEALLSAHMAADVKRLRARVPDAVALAMADLFVRELGALQKADPEKCWRYDMTGAIDIKPLISAELSAEDVSMSSRILVEATQHPVEPISVKEGERLRDKAFMLGKAKGIDPRHIAAAFVPGAHHADVCPASIQLFQLAGKLPPAEGASLIRFLVRGEG